MTGTAVSRAVLKVEAAEAARLEAATALVAAEEKATEAELKLRAAAAALAAEQEEAERARAEAKQAEVGGGPSPQGSHPGASLPIRQSWSVSPEISRLRRARRLPWNPRIDRSRAAGCMGCELRERAL